MRGDHPATGKRKMSNAHIIDGSSVNVKRIISDYPSMWRKKRKLGLDTVSIP